MRTLVVLGIVAGALLFVAVPAWRAQTRFQVVETTIEQVHAAYKSGELTARQLVQMYLDRIEAYDKQGPRINSVITLNPNALAEADKLDAALKASGFVGPLHGIPLVLKDQVDMAGLPTTYGSIVRKDFVAARDSVAVEKVKKAGGIFVAKVTLGEMGGGDTYGSLFGATRNPYDLLRTPGGSSGGPGAAVAANFATVGIGQEGSASVRRPAAWNSLIGLRPTRGLVSSTRGATGLSPMARTVTDAAKLLDAMVGYDPEDPITAHGVGHIPKTYTEFLDRNGLKGARIGVFSESVGIRSNPNAADYKEIEALFNRAVGELRSAGAEMIPITIPHVKELMAAVDENAGGRAIRFDGEDEDSWANYPNRPFKNEEEMRKSPDYAKVFISPNRPGLYQSAFTTVREQLLMTVLKVMADHQLDAIVHRSVEHSPSLIEEGLNPPYKNMDGAIRLNTQLWWASNLQVPAGYTAGGLPVGITLLGRPYAEPVLIKLAYAYEQATKHRKPPASTPELQRRSGT
jgi:Asp-tRNA(Asn)/Glu-tRNA(Gln) amidotransferase A subunit family amidase